MNRENTKSINPSVLKTISETLDIDQATAEQVLHLFSDLIFIDFFFKRFFKGNQWIEHIDQKSFIRWSHRSAANSSSVCSM